MLSLFDTLSLADRAFRKLAKGAEARLKHLELATECLQESLNLARDHVFGHAATFVEAHFDNCLSPAERTTDRVVEDVGEFLIRDRSNLIWIQVPSLVVHSEVGQLAV